MEGLIFGLVDNGVLLVGAYTGLEIDRLFNGRGALGAVIGAGVGNTISDALGAALDPTMNGALLGIVVGCIIPLFAIPVIEYIKARRAS